MAEPKLDKLIKKRSCIKSKLTIFSNYLALLKSSHSLSSVQLLDLESRFNKFNSLYATFDELQCDIEMLSDSIDNECIEREHFENQYHTLTAEARSLLGEQPAQRRELRDSSVTSFEDAQAARVKVQDCNGVEHVARVLLDNGSTANFVTASLCGKLGLSRRSASTTVTDNKNFAKYLYKY
ncbi:hypothetical protein ACJJTC_002795 [Scirpophaga incertulas]